MAVGNPAQSENPLLESSITGRELRHDIRQAMDAHGFAFQSEDADLSVAYYADVRRRLEVTNYDYGYPFWGWSWRWGPGWGGWPAQEVTSFEQGTVVIDVLDRAGRRLLWRGVGKTEVPRDETEYPKVIAETVSAIMSKFPVKR